MSLTFERQQGRMPSAGGTGEMATFAVPKPLYSQVRDMLASQISSGQWAQGTALPNETVLAQSFGVSIGTIRRAVEGLEDLGIVVRRQGRGTFIAGLGLPAAADKLRRLRNPQGVPLDISHRLLGISIRPATSAEAADFRLSTHFEAIEVRQAVLVGTTLIGVQNSILAGVETGRLQDSLRQGRDVYTALGETGLMVIRAEDTISATVADATDGSALGVAQGSSLLQVDRRAFTIGDRLMEMRSSRYLPAMVAYQAAAT